MLIVVQIFVFQSTLPRRERQFQQCVLRCCGAVSIHAPTKGATCRDFILYRVIVVSIHAPTKGATGWLGGFKNCLAVSIHAPTKGATVIPWLLSTRIKTFQSTLPRRERPHLGQYGAIPCPFQSTLPRRERLTGTILHFRGCWFQSTLPRRERRWLGLPHTYFVTVSIHAPTKGATHRNAQA